MMYDDVVLASQVIAMSLYRLWGDQSWDQVEWGRLTESIADGAFSKVRPKIRLFSNYWVVVFKSITVICTYRYYLFPLFAARKGSRKWNNTRGIY